MNKEDKQKPIFGLEKLPLKAYIRALENRISELSIESGKDKAYIDELEYKLKSFDGTDFSEVKKENAYKQIKAEMNKYKKENVRLMKSNKELVNQIINLKNQTNGS